MQNAAQRKKLTPWDGGRKDGKRDEIPYGQRRTWRRRGMALLIILGVVWTSENETRDSS